MNALKNVLFFGLLIAVLCGVYIALSRQPEATLPEELTSQATPPKVEVPGLTCPLPGSVPSTAAGGSAAIAPAPSVPAASSSGGTAPPFQPAGSTIATSAPAFPPPAQGGSGEMRDSLPPPPIDQPPAMTNNAASVRDPFTPAARAQVAAAADLPSPAEGASATANGNRPLADAKIGAGPAPVTTQVSLPSPPTEEHTRPASIDAILRQVDQKMGENKLADALLILSQLQGDPDVPEYQAQKITEILDQMAAKVIYSREALLGDVYRVKPDDTLDSIADHYQVPALLLSRINGIRGPQDLRQGKELKVLQGPFSAHVSTSRSELKMVLGGRYAGRFSMTLSSDLHNAMGLYHVVAKSALGAAGAPAAPQWVELENAAGKIGIQGTPDLRAAAGSGRSTIWLSEQDMDDVYGILSVGSVVIIQR